jgi:hypothetical protein
MKDQPISGSDAVTSCSFRSWYLSPVLLYFDSTSTLSDIGEGLFEYFNLNLDLRGSLVWFVSFISSRIGSSYI